jgi:acyl carrier protein
MDRTADSMAEGPARVDEVSAAFRTAMRLEETCAVRDDMGFDDIPGWDSVGHMNLITELESRFGITLDMDEIIGLSSVGAVRALVVRKRGGLEAGK